MSSSQSHTPEDVTLQLRNRRYQFDEVLASDWHGGDPVKTAFFNAMSILFPIGEKFFVDSVRRYQKQLSDPILLKQIKQFSAQEAAHLREHQRHNEVLCAARGFDLEQLERKLRERLAHRRATMPPIVHLGATTAYEHWTAMLADLLLRNPAVMAGAHPLMADLWRWHATEETEHKAVAFDVYRAVGGTDALLRKLMAYVTRNYFMDISRIMYLMLRTHPQASPKMAWQSIRLLFGRDGWLRPLWPQYKAFFRRGFHPWQHDNRDLLQPLEPLPPAA